MFIISLNYVKPLEEIDSFLDEHVIFLKKQYEENNFIASGRKVPRTGGIILSKIKDKSKLESIIKGDPFYINELAEYEIIEFIPTMVSDNFTNLKEI